MKELTLPAKCLLLASATLMIGFSTLARCQGNEKSAGAVSRAAQSSSSAHSALNFITWPKSAFAEATSPFVIGVLGTPTPEQAEQIEKYSSQPRQIHRRSVRVVRFKSAEDISGCHVLFVSRSCNHDQTAAALQKVFGLPVLTVGETEGFALAGGVMNLVPGRSGRGFELNIRAAERQQLKIDGRLETLATTIEEP